MPQFRYSPSPGPRRARAGSASYTAAAVNSLRRTRLWCGVNAVIIMLLGGMLVWREADRRAEETLAPEETAEPASGLDTALSVVETSLTLVIAAGCVLAGFCLLRYLAAINLLTDDCDLPELESTLRWQKRAWILLGVTGAAWLLSIVLTTVFFVGQWSSLEAAPQ